MDVHAGCREDGQLDRMLPDGHLFSGMGLQVASAGQHLDFRSLAEIKASDASAQDRFDGFERNADVMEPPVTDQHFLLSYGNGLLAAVEAVGQAAFQREPV